MGMEVKVRASIHQMTCIRLKKGTANRPQLLSCKLNLANGTAVSWLYMCISQVSKLHNMWLIINLQFLITLLR